MKKTIATIVSTALCLSLAIPIPALAFDQKPTVISDNWNSIMAELDASEHGGIYIENGVLHVKPVARDSIVTKNDVFGFDVYEPATM